MTTFSSIARPYALAAFNYAREHNGLIDWLIFLKNAAAITDNKDLQSLFHNPEINPQEIFSIYVSLLKPSLDKHKENFLHLLLINKRLIFLPSITALYESYYGALEKISKVRVVTALEADQAFKEKLHVTLSKRINTEVSFEYQID